MLHVLIESEGVGVNEGAVLAPVLYETAALWVMHAARIAMIGPGESPALAVKIQTIGVATAFSKNLETFGWRMITPDGLAQKLDALNLCCTRAAVCAVYPAIRAPAQAIGS